jgi:hypothetical protein
MKPRQENSFEMCDGVQKIKGYCLGEWNNNLGAGFSLRFSNAPRIIAASPTQRAAFCATCLLPSDANQDTRVAGAFAATVIPVLDHTLASTHESINPPLAASLSAYESKHVSAMY